MARLMPRLAPLMIATLPDRCRFLDSPLTRSTDPLRLKPIASKQTPKRRIYKTPPGNSSPAPLYSMQRSIPGYWERFVYEVPIVQQRGYAPLAPEEYL